MLTEIWQLWAVMGILCWVVGFIRAGLGNIRGSPKDSAFISPAWIYLLCGQPRTQKLPRGVMWAAVAIVQLQGLLLLVLALTAYLAPRIDPLVQTFVMFIGTVVLCIAVFRLYKKYPYKPH